METQGREKPSGSTENIRFLLKLNSNYRSVLHRFRDTDLLAANRNFCSSTV